MGVIIKKDDDVLLGKRRGAHGEGTWSFPGGHLEFGESPEECAERETLEEVNLQIKNIQRSVFTNDFFEKEHKHYITLFMTSEYSSGDVEVMEPDKCEEWRWFKWNNLPQPLFLGIIHLKDQGYSPFNSK